MRSRRILGLLTVVAVAAAVVGCAAGAVGERASETGYPYGDRQFTRFVDDSYSVRVKGESRAFYKHMEDAYRSYFAYKDAPATLEAWMETWKGSISKASGGQPKAAKETALGKALHTFVKKSIPTFSLERGYEFCYVVECGERQCYLQSVLIAGLMQKAGVKAGVVMVYRNLNGAQSNLGHAVTVARLSNGRDIIVDASEPMPFPRHRGLLVGVGNSYSFVKPVYKPSSEEISAYQPESGGKVIPTATASCLQLDYVASQFYYYRGERVPGGIFAPKRTAAGLDGSLKHLKKATQLCPKNPLAVYMLWRVYLAQGKKDLAAKQAPLAYNLYKKYGYFPGGSKDLIAAVGKNK